MIAITRSLAKSIRHVFTKALDLRRRDAATQSLELVTSSRGLTARAHTALHAVEYHAPGQFPDQRLIIPWALLKYIEGNRAEIVTLTSDEDNGVVAKWQEGAMPRSIRHIVSEAKPDAPPFPTEPAEFARVGSGFVRALHEAMEVTDQHSSRYALGCVQLRTDGAIVATDGHQALRQMGFMFPLADDVLLPATSVFGCQELSTVDRALLAVTQDHVVIRDGGWTLYRGLTKEGRFPRVDDVIPASDYAVSIAELASADCEFLAANLRRLPAAKDVNAPVTVELNGCVLVRARGSGDVTATELILTNSRNLAQDASFATNRNFLERAVRLGFSKLCTFDKHSPILCHDNRRHYIWMRLDSSCAVAGESDSVRVESPRISRVKTKRTRACRR